MIPQVLSGTSPFLRSLCVNDHLPGRAPVAPQNLCVLCLCTPGSGAGPHMLKEHLLNHKTDSNATTRPSPPVIDPFQDVLGVGR